MVLSADDRRYYRRIGVRLETEDLLASPSDFYQLLSLSSADEEEGEYWREPKQVGADPRAPQGFGHGHASALTTFPQGHPKNWALHGFC